YKLEEYLPEFLALEQEDESQKQRDLSIRLLSDYRETIGELLLENFTRQWTEWAHAKGSRTRNQAHGSPGNLIDLYATVDIPECEGFGLSSFGIQGLRADTIIRKNDSDLSMLKYASSGAHIAGKPFTSSETFTWLTEHFRTSLSQCKPELDLFFVAGVNRVFFHGTTYSPKEEAWPGWKFYASVDMSPTNTLWRDAGAMFEYITRCQSFLQYGRPDNDFLVYLPVYDMWSRSTDSRLLMFSIHDMEKRAPAFIETIHAITQSGYDVDYISDHFIRTTVCEDGLLKTTGGTTYKALILPAVHLMPEDVLEHLLELAAQGAKIIFAENYPQDVPGFSDLEKRRMKFHRLKAQLPVVDSFSRMLVSDYGQGKIITGNQYAGVLAATGVPPEEMKTRWGLSAIRRSHPDGHHYFISSLQPDQTDDWVSLAVEAKSALLFDPMTGKSGKAKLRTRNGQTQLRLQLHSGESVIVKTFADIDVEGPAWNYWHPAGDVLSLADGWHLSFIESDPGITGTFYIGQLGSWTTLDIPGVTINRGTALYTNTFDLPAGGMPEQWILDLGDVRESARVRINGQEAGILWAVPFRTEIGQYLRPGTNTIEIEVTNLPANRIADYDRREVEWRKFKEINFVDLNYKGTTYGHWTPVESGLLGEVRLIPVGSE
ncbi:MAG: glycosyl hydrolase family 2, partial [Tannerellaceae bacterium]|nr:glycosyl hydrolase family 2 [Tannerellaceae bacterium]